MGWKRQIEFAGRPLQLGVIEEAMLNSGVSVTAIDATPPCAVATDDEDAVTAKSGEG